MVVESPWPTLAPYPKAFAPLWLEGAALRHGDKAAFVDREGKTCSFRQAVTLARRIGRFLQEEGIAKGDRVAVISSNYLTLIPAYLGALWAGGVAYPMSPLYKGRELRYFLADSGAWAVLAVESAVAGVEEVRADLPDLQGLYSLEELEERVRDVPPEPLPVAIDPDKDLAALFYTGGTTGIPKGAPLTHANVLAAVRQYVPARSHNSYDVFLCFAPYYHAFSMLGLGFFGLYNGATQVVMPRFDPQESLALTERYRATHILTNPTGLMNLTEAAQKGPYDLSSLVLIAIGNAPLPVEVWRRGQEVLGCAVASTYGSTETSGLTINIPWRFKAGSVGPLFPDTQARFLDLEADEDVPPGGTGEIAVRGPQVFGGYWQRPDANAEAFTADGFFRTGDVGRADEDGYIYIVDRKKAIIKYKGYQVPAAELEALLLEHPAIQEVVVIPKPVLEVGEIPKALVVLRPEAQASPEELKKELMAFVEARVAPYKKVREVEFVQAIPRSPAGKVLRQELMDRERAIPPGGSPGPGRAG